MIKGEVNVTAETHLRANYLISKTICESLHAGLHEAVRQLLVTNLYTSTAWGTTQKGLLITTNYTFESILLAVENCIKEKIKSIQKEQ